MNIHYSRVGAACCPRCDVRRPLVKNVSFLGSLVLMACSILLLLQASPAAAASGTIMLVTDRADLEQDTAGLAGYLRELGYDVEVNASPGNASEFRVLDATKISRLSAKDLVIVHRATSSGDFNTDATERGTWNNLDVPLLLMSPFLVRASRWNWMPGDISARAGYTDHVIVNPDHPIVTALGPNMFTVGRNLDAMNTNDTANGVLIANAPNSGATIGDWGDPGGVAAFFRGTAGETHIRRRVFCALHNYHEAGAWTDISENGKAIVARAVAYTMTGSVGPVPPRILNLSPAPNATFYPAENGISFEATNAAAIPTENISVILNGVDVSAQLNISGDPTARTVTYQNLQPNLNYSAVITVTNENGETSVSLNFDTFVAATATIIEVEDYNYDPVGDTCLQPIGNRFSSGTGGTFIDNPVPGAYSNLIGVVNVDYSVPVSITNEIYRCSFSGTESLGIQISGDFHRANHAALGVPEFHIGQTRAGQWINYTRTFDAGAYLVYLRAASQGAQQVRLDTVIDNEPGTPPGEARSANQSTNPVGTFQIPVTGIAFRNVPLTDLDGNPLVITLPSVQTLRLTAVNANNNLQMNYLFLVPTSAPPDLPPYLASVSPASGAANVEPDTIVDVSIVNRNTSVDVSTIRLFFNGADVTMAAVVTPNASGASISYDPPGLLTTNSSHTVRLVFADDAPSPRSFTNEWQFTVRGLPVLFVVATTQFAGDVAFRNLLLARGYAVTTIAAPASTTADADNKGLVVVSSSPTSGDVGLKFRDVTVPVINWEQALQDEFGMTIDSGVDHGTITNQMAVNIIAPYQPFGACLAGGERIVVNSPQTFSWGVPQGDATIIATLTNDPLNRAVIYGYESGAMMNAGFIAPARRVHLFLEDNTAAALNDTGRQLVNAAISWALGASPNCPPVLASPVFNGGLVSLTFNTQSGSIYIVEYSNSLTPPVWTELTRMTGTGSSLTVDDPSPSPAMRFYRLRVE